MPLCRIVIALFLCFAVSGSLAQAQGMPGMAPPGGLGGPLSAPPGPDGVAYGEAEGGPGCCENCGGTGCGACGGSGGDCQGWSQGRRGCSNCGPDYPGTARPRWFNVDVEFMLLTREDAGRDIDFTTAGSRQVNPFAPVVLDTGRLDFNEEPGFRMTGQFLVGPGADVEFSYFGTFLFDAQARATGAGNLFSSFSDFGVNPVNGFVDSDRAILQTLAYESRFDSGELNYRRHFGSPNGRIQHSWLVGVRYARLDEEFIFNSLGNNNNESLNYLVTAKNDLTGAQLGGDISIAALPWITFGGELKVGLYGNHSEQKSTISATEPGANVTTTQEFGSNDSAALLAEGGIYTVIFCTEHFSLRSGYRMVYLESVALAPAQVNFERGATGSFANRLPVLDATGNVFLHGLTTGLEITW